MARVVGKRLLSLSTWGQECCGVGGQCPPPPQHTLPHVEGMRSGTAQEIRNYCVCLICQETVAVYKEFHIKRHYQSRHSTYEKLTGHDRSEKLKQLEAVLMSQQQFFTRACESNENATKASYEVAMLTAKNCKSFAEGDFIK